ncbi:uracil phosphoribosyltransferase [Belliella sp. R4-6]|uniref:Uracil phosphoribosyltransferase n=1 Tax=Belliella alkalica TaxID=1730871 RepID=A0ABS9V8N9_9BACT|nr:uracil phosphoribosyltransferase [Belliella alkalica]MCH7412787.1 uracil phosphoribosyltransferase [Belliella alkalica]
MFILNKNNSIANQFLSELRDIKVHKDRLRFRKNLERLGEILAYEVSKSLDYKESEIETPLQKTKVNTLKTQPILISVLRAAVPFYQGFSNIFDHSDSGFIGAYRVEESGNEEINISLQYQATPDLTDKEVILIDPMLATGKSFVKSVENLLKNGRPKKIHIAAVIAAPEGINYIKNNLDLPFSIWICALDEKLNSASYIVPGLGDAGDLAYGSKL